MAHSKRQRRKLSHIFLLKSLMLMRTKILRNKLMKSHHSQEKTQHKKKSKERRAYLWKVNTLADPLLVNSIKWSLIEETSLQCQEKWCSWKIGKDKTWVQRKSNHICQQPQSNSQRRNEEQAWERFHRQKSLPKKVKMITLKINSLAVVQFTRGFTISESLWRGIEKILSIKVNRKRWKNASSSQMSEGS